MTMSYTFACADTDLECWGYISFLTACSVECIAGIIQKKGLVSNLLNC